MVLALLVDWSNNQHLFTLPGQFNFTFKLRDHLLVPQENLQVRVDTSSQLHL